jgi:glutathione S-transferase
MSTVELYSFEGCPYAQRTRMTLIEKGIEFKLTEIDLFNRPDWFRQISPYGKVPVLLHNGGTIYESAIINQYLDEAFPEPPLMPPDPLGRAQARIWMDYCETRFLTTTHRLMTEAGDPGRRAANVEALAEVLRFMEFEGLRRLGDGPWFMGRQLTLVDLQFSPFFERFGTYVEMAGAIWPEDCTRLREWFTHVQELPSYRATAHDTAFHIEARRQMLARIAARREAEAGSGTDGRGTRAG